MDERKKIIFSNTSRLMNIFIITIISIQLILIPAFGESVDHKEGYDVISYDNGTTEIISGALNYEKWDGSFQPLNELDISKGNWPYLFSENESAAEVVIDDTTLVIPKGKTKIKPKLNSFDFEYTFSKSEFQGKKQDINATDAFLDFSYDLKSKTPKAKEIDDYNIKEGRLHFRGGSNKVIVHDDTLENYTEGGVIYQDYTYLIPPEYDLKIEGGKIHLTFKKNALDKLNGNIIVKILGWGVDGASDSLWGSDITFFNTAEVRSTGNAELQQKVSDCVLCTRFDEGSGTLIHNENPNVPDLNPYGDLLGTVGTETWTTGKYGQAIHFDGVKNKVLFNDDPELRLPNNFTISLYINVPSSVNNLDTDITRKGSTNTANPKQWYKLEIKNNVMQGVVYKGGTEIAEKDSTTRNDGNWHFVVYTRKGTTCTLFVDGIKKGSRTNCPVDTGNTAQLAIGAKDTEDSGTGTDYTHGTIDDVRFFKRPLSDTERTYVRNNEHLASGTITRNLASVIGAGQEVKGLACDGAWTKPAMMVDVQASTDNVNWNTIQSNADPNVLYSVSSGNNYRYSRCSLSTTDPSKTPEISSLRATIGPIGTEEPGITVFVRGTDQGVWYRKLVGTTWGTWTNLGGRAISNISTVTLGSNTYIFIRGTDNSVWFNKKSGTSWSGWTSMEGRAASDPDAAVLGSDLYVFIRGFENAIWINRLSGSTWSGWTSLEGSLKSNPEAAIMGSELYVFNHGSDSALWYRKLIGSAWSIWTNMGGNFTSDPEAASNDLFIRGSDNSLWTNRLSGSTWNGWARLGGSIASNPDAIPNEVFVRGSDKSIWYNKWSGSSWGGWHSLGGNTSSDPETIASGSDVYVFARGSDNALWYRKLTAGTWESWKSLNGHITSNPSAVVN